jgi:hypothetical protein
MKSLSSSLTALFTKFDTQTIRLIVVIATLVMFVISAGAPQCGGGIGH